MQRIMQRSSCLRPFFLAVVMVVLVVLAVVMVVVVGMTAVVVGMVVAMTAVVVGMVALVAEAVRCRGLSAPWSPPWSLAGRRSA